MMGFFTLFSFFYLNNTHNICTSQVKEEQKHQEEAAVFKARPNTVIHKEPFRPKKEARPAVGKDAQFRLKQILCVYYHCCDA